ncbi:hypothetical protein OXPF_40650 [Oxobacter pfennigii]|uniref:Peptidase M15C domain-containing protein n=1 Tax=Oxobacter pfennigii TaxID=36849 RepID=A0A0N8NSK4_9CLOT|nr:M15 family metallopeptidase [Oxobacter pfennigii]KPU42280.1 hypothetical protein OXPF_40650 [Oxobacter pfennigii]
MKKSLLCVLLFISVICLGCKSIVLSSLNQLEDDYEIIMKRDILCLMMAYPDYITGAEKMENESVFIIMKSGKRVLYDDKRQKTFEMKMSNPDIQDMMEVIYPINDIKALMPLECDPGRIRVYSILKEVYGSTKEKIQSNLTGVKFGYKSLSFNKNNNAACALTEVSKELIPLAYNKSKIYSCLFPPSGTFNYRNISGTNLLSPHSFGIAIDLSKDKRDYWKWTNRETGEKRMLSYPREIVKIFEKNNFIWGGKWGHFDILHFEYRPEIIYKALYFSKAPDKDSPWYSGLDKRDDNIRKYIETIDNAL